MNNDNWLDDIRNKMTDFEQDEPSGLWERIETHLSDRQQITPIKPQRSPTRHSAALACSCLPAHCRNALRPVFL